MNKSWFATHPTVRRIAWVAVGLVVAYSAVEILGEGWTKSVIAAFARKFGVEIEPP